MAVAKDERGIVPIDGGAIAYRVQRSARRWRTVAIGVDRDGVIVTAPLRTSRQEIEAIVAARATWILRRLGEGQPPELEFVEGARLPFRGAEVILAVEAGGQRPKVRLHGDALVLTTPEPLDQEANEEAVLRWYRLEAQRAVREFVMRWAAAMDLQPRQVIVKDQQRRWGSCSPGGVLRFNWRLVALDLALLEYVVVHELAHMRHPNHSPAFWAEVARYQPESKALRARLRTVRLPW